MKIFEDYAYYYNLFYQDKDYKGEAQYIHKLIQKYNKGSKSILNLGCGTGNHDINLYNLGYEVHGVDLSKDMIVQAKKNKIKNKLTFDIGDIRNYDINKKFNNVISLFHVMSYQNSNEDLKNAFKTAYKHLTAGGIFIFDCWYGPGVLTDPPAVRVKRIETEKYNIVRIAEPKMYAEKNIVDVCYQIVIADKKNETFKEIKEVHSMRYLFNPEIEYILNEVGFKLIDCFEFGNDKSLDYCSWNACFVGVKI